MKWTILGSGGCQVIPKPLCDCRVCAQAREKGTPYARTGPSAYLHDIGLLIDTPAESALQLNRSRIDRVEYILFTHLDPDHCEGFRIVEQIALDFRNWKAYPQKQICLLLPPQINDRLVTLSSQFGPLIDFYKSRGFVRIRTFDNKTSIEDIDITAIPIERGRQTVFIYVFEKRGEKAVYAPCDLKPFPIDRSEVQKPDLLIIQPGIFETGLKHGFAYPSDHISRKTLYTFEQTMNIAQRIDARKTVFVHLEEYWNRSYDDYRSLQSQHGNISFAWDGMMLEI